MKTHFDCDRTCKRWKACQFSAIFDAVGPTFVHSHTVTVQIEFRDRDAFGRAAEALGGKALGEGTELHSSTTETGYGISLPRWHYPLVLRADGVLAFDDYQGHWGDRADIERLKAAYAVEVAVTVCEQQGWMFERQADGALLVFHPTGGTLTVSQSGEIDANGFNGVGCAAATETIASALGKTLTDVKKVAYTATQQTISEA